MLEVLLLLSLKPFAVFIVAFEVSKLTRDDDVGVRQLKQVK